jgi:hypothetical protein
MPIVMEHGRTVNPRQDQDRRPRTAWRDTMSATPAEARNMHARGGSRSKRILVVNAHFDDARRRDLHPTTVLKAMGPVYLAGAFDRRACEVRLHDEQTSGPLEDPGLLGWPDMLVLTGLTNAFDRMLHLCAYARTRNRRVVVVAGGPAIRALPHHAARFFDYACQGDVEELREVAAEVWGAGFAAEEMVPRYDLAYWIRSVGHVEASRYCNFHCTFCSLTGERRAFRSYELAYVRAQIEALGRRRFLVFIDNNFYGPDRTAFRARLALVRDLFEQGWFQGWGALVTSDFFLDDENLRLARESGCRALYCGIESFDRATLVSYRKQQNTLLPQAELIRRSLEAGILLTYGLVLDPGARRLAEIEAEIDALLGLPELVLPAMFTLTIPYPSTPFFRECAQAGRILPSTKLRDLDGKTLSVRPLDPIADVARFVRDLQSLRGRRWRALRHGIGTWRRYRKCLDGAQLAMMSAREAALMGAFGLLDRLTPSALASVLVGRRAARTHVSTTERLDDAYRPKMPVDGRFEDHFRPTLLTDERGAIHPALAADLVEPSLALVPG